MDKPEAWTNKWKAPPWMKPGTRVRVFKGRKYPVGATGTLLLIESTGHGVEAEVQFDPGFIKPDGFFPERPYHRNISILNLEPEPMAVS